MGFTLELGNDLVDVDAGSPSPVVLTVTNRGAATDRFEIEVEGIDAEWKAVPVPVFTVEAGEKHSERVFIRPPRASESLAGNYPFAVTVRSLESGEQKTSPGVIQLKPFHHVTMEINPKRGSYSTFSKRNVFEVSVVNLGNTEHTLQLVGNDPEDSCTYEFDQAQVTVGPGQQKHLSATVHPTSNPVLSGSHLIGFSITGRSVDVPTVVGTAQAQLEQRSAISPSSLIIAILFVLVVGGWWIARPKPPGIQLTVDPVNVTQGSPVLISWVAHDANHVKITATEADRTVVQVVEGPDLQSSRQIQLDVPGSAQIVAEVSKDSVDGPPEHKTVMVTALPAKVKPEIQDFTASPLRVQAGAPITFKWHVKDAVTVEISPWNKVLDADLPSDTESFDTSGPLECILTAKSVDGTTTQSKQPIKIEVVGDANIVSFDASPSSVLQGQTTTLTWQVLNSSLVNLKVAGSAPQKVDPSGTATYAINAKTQFVLTAYDAQSRPTIKKIVVTVQAPPPPPITQPDSTYPSTGTDGTSPGTPPGNPPPTTTGTATAGATGNR
jgi:hypothetical protein